MIIRRYITHYNSIYKVTYVWCLFVLLLNSCTSKSSGTGTQITDTTIATDSPKTVTKPVNKNDASTLPNIVGNYKAVPLDGEDTGACNLVLSITRQNNQYLYRFTIQDSIVTGKVTLSKSEDLQQAQLLLTLEGIKWASYEGDISNEDEHPAEDLEIPVGITMGFLNKELTFQNYGNAMNSYTVLNGCDQKFVRLIKQ